MPITATTRDQHGMYPETPIIGEYRTDNERIAIHNPANATVMYLAGEPIIVTVAGIRQAYMIQGPIRPGETGYAIRNFSADFPCILSADVVEGTAIYWDIDEDADGFPVGAAKIAGDVTNGFVIGYATHAYTKDQPTLSAGKVVCGTAASTYIRVTSVQVAATVKGTVP